MNIGRLTRIIEVLERVEQQGLTLNMEKFATCNTSGFSACALGYAALDTEFQEQGLLLYCTNSNQICRSIEDVNCYSQYVIRCMENNIRCNIYEYFGLNIYQLRDCFGQHGYPHIDITARDVIDKIKSIIAEYQPITQNVTQLETA